ncbi:porin PorA family protein [Nocardia sp. NPDC005825]|uniref:porin PorA family protein n=1 Tax=unclassified Nocardia TaxID=2637762 RepID=UPI0033C194A3
MTIRRSSLALIVAGVVLIAVAGVLRFAVVPALSKLPGDTDTTAHYEGTATLLNAKALQSGDTAHALLTGLPITVDRHIYVSATSDDAAVVHDDATINAPGGTKVEQNHVYALDRVTLTDAPAPGGAEVEPHTGLTVALAMNPPADDSQRYWDSGIQATVPLTYKGSDKVHGRDVHRYEASAHGPLKSPSTLRTLPAQLPKALVEQLLPTLPAGTQDALRTALPTLPDAVPLTYASSNQLNVAVDSELGLPITATQQQQVVAGLEAGGQHIDLLPVMALDIKTTDASSRASADQVKSASSKLRLVADYLPLAAALLGVAAIVAGIVRRRPVAAA